MLYTDRTRLCHLLLTTALSNRSRSSKAVCHAMRALSSYLRDGASTRVDQLKQEALHALYIEQLPSNCDAIEHIAANLLLCILEVSTFQKPHALPHLTFTAATNLRQRILLVRLYHWSQASSRSGEEGRLDPGRRRGYDLGMGILLRRDGPLQLTALAHRVH